MKTPLGLVLALAVAGGVAGGAGAAFFLNTEQPAARVDRGYDDSALREDLASLREEMRRNFRDVAGVADKVERSAKPVSAEDSEVEIERPIIAEYYQRCFGTELSESGVHATLT